MDRAKEIAADWIESVANRPIRIGRLLGLDEFELRALPRREEQS